MRERFRADVAGCHFLQAIVANCGGRTESRFDVAAFEQSALLRGMSPHTGEAIRLQLHPHGERILLARVLLLEPAHFRFDADEFLHMVADFVGEHVGLREFPWSPESLL